MPSKLSWLLQATGVTTFTATTGFFVYTKHCIFEPMDPATDPTFKSKSFKQLNPSGNRTFHDVCVRRIPLAKLDPDLSKNAGQGGSKLVERFAQGVWGGFGFDAQRRILSQWYERDHPNQLWSKDQLQSSPYTEGTEVANHFNVLERPDNDTIIFRCGDSPVVNPGTPRESDGLFEMTAKAKVDEGFAEFRLKSVFFQGQPQTDKAPFDGEPFKAWAHRMYDKLLMEDAVGHCRRPVIDIDWEAVRPGSKTPQTKSQ